MMQDPDAVLARLARVVMLLTVFVVVVLAVALWVTVVPPRPAPSLATAGGSGVALPGSYHRPPYAAPDTATIPHTAAGRQIRYGRALVARTAAYLGPHGSVGTYTNGMNCQNCHLEAGTQPFANNYLAVSATYPKFRARSGQVETIPKRVADCMERSLNGRAVPPDGPEMRALVAYIQWLGAGIPKGKKVLGTGFVKLPYLDRAADPMAGQAVFLTKCQTCHGAHGEGRRLPGQRTYQYPPLWGPASYNDAAGLYRLSNFAKYVKVAMPFGATYDRPLLTDAEAWDLAAFINSRPRPHKATPHDWPDPSQKPVDYPVGPYTDPFSARQHKYGPFQPIEAAHAQPPTSPR